MRAGNLLVTKVAKAVDFFLRDIRVPFRGIEVHYSGYDRRFDHGGLETEKCISDNGNDMRKAWRI